MKTSEAILSWLDENKDWFKAESICKKTGINKGNFSKFRKNGEIPEKHLIPIMEIIMPLGFTLEGVITENNKPENKARIDNERNGMPEWERKQKEDRIKTLQNELKSPPSTASIGVKNWIKLRQNELTNLIKEL